MDLPVPLGAGRLTLAMTATGDDGVAAAVWFEYAEGDDVAVAVVVAMEVIVAIGLEALLEAEMPPGLLDGETVQEEPAEAFAEGMITIDRPVLVDGGMAAFPHCPRGVASAVVTTVSTASPGFGNIMSLPSGVVHCVSAMFATNMSGSFSKSVLSLAPPLTEIGAQFIYISLLPILLNHVHTSVHSPFGTSFGTVKMKVAGSVPVVGHPPTIEWMTLKVDCAVGSLFKLTLSWQLPPPWVALPAKLRV